MTNDDNILQLGLFFSPSALQPIRKPSQKHKTESDSAQGESQASYSSSGGSVPSGLCYDFVFSLLKAMLSG